MVKEIASSEFEKLSVNKVRRDTFTKALVVDGNKVDQADKRVTQWVSQVHADNN